MKDHGTCKFNEAGDRGQDEQEDDAEGDGDVLADDGSAGPAEANREWEPT
jgi:hypothetical protein